MSSAAFAPASHSAANENSNGYLHNVAVAARALAAALFAVRPASDSAPQAAPASRVKDMLALYHMAREYDSVMPNLADELRVIAARG